MVGTIKRLLYTVVLKSMLKDKDKIGLTGKQKSQIEMLLVKAKEI